MSFFVVVYVFIFKNSHSRPLICFSIPDKSCNTINSLLWENILAEIDTLFSKLNYIILVNLT